jgi:hypothetical protein
MKNTRLRRLLYEDPTTGPNVAGIGNYENKLFQLALNNGCYKGFIPTKDQIPQIKQEYPHSFGEAFYKKSNNSELSAYPHMYIVPNQDGNSFRVSYRDDSGAEKQFVAATLCNEIKSTTDTVKSKDEQQIIDYLNDKGYKEWSQVSAKEMFKYQLVNPATDKDVLGLIGNDKYLLGIINNPEIKTFRLYKPRQTASGMEQGRRDLGDEAQFVLKRAKDNGYLEPSEAASANLDLTQYEKVDLQKPESYIGVLAGYEGYATNFTSPFIIYRPKGTKNLSTNAKKLVDYLITPNGGGWKPLDDFSPAEQRGGELEKVDLSDARYYSGDLITYKDQYPQLFPKGYIIARKVNIALSDAGVLNQETCRKVILDYYNKMITSRPGISPSLNEKRRVEACLNTFKGRYPKLKDNIENLVRPPRGKDAFAITPGDYTSGGLMKKITKSKDVIDTNVPNPESDLQESRDRLLKNIISENLIRLKKKQLLERTLSSKNTYRY